MSAGNLKIGGQRPVPLRIIGEVGKSKPAQRFLLSKSGKTEAVYLKDIAEYILMKKDKTTLCSRIWRESVVMLDVKKRAGSKSIGASDQNKGNVIKTTKANYSLRIYTFLLQMIHPQELFNQVDGTWSNNTFLEIIFGG